MTADSLDLVIAAQSGDIDAFGKLYAEYRNQVFAFLLRRTTHRQLAEDLTHDVFVRALRSIDGWQYQGRDIGAWLNTIARNLLTDHRKAAHQRLSVSIGDFIDAGIDVRERRREGNPEAAVIEQLHDTALLRALWLINEDQRTCLVHRYVQGLSVAETAEAMGRAEGAVKALAHRAIQALAARLGDEVRP